MMKSEGKLAAMMKSEGKLAAMMKSEGKLATMMKSEGKLALNKLALQLLLSDSRLAVEFRLMSLNASFADLYGISHLSVFASLGVGANRARHLTAHEALARGLERSSRSELAKHLGKGHLLAVTAGWATARTGGRRARAGTAGRGDLLLHAQAQLQI
jgi:hypothetical protein